MSKLEAFMAGYIDTKEVITIDVIPITRIEKKLICDGILLKK